MASQEVLREAPSRASLINDPKVRSIFYQCLVVALLVSGVWWIVHNTIVNLTNLHIASGFGFLRGRAGFDISDTPIAYTSDSTYFRAILVGLINTLIVAFVRHHHGHHHRLHRRHRPAVENWLIQKICTVYVEVFRNIPPLLVIFFWYSGVLAVLPAPRDSINLPFGSFLNQRGFYFPRAIWGDGSWLILVGLLAGIAMAWFVAHKAHQRQMATGQQFPVFWTSLALIVGLPLLAYALSGFPLTFDFPKQSTFNLTGGFQVKPEFLSLYLALSFYTAAFI